MQRTEIKKYTIDITRDYLARVGGEVTPYTLTGTITLSAPSAKEAIAGLNDLIPHGFDVDNIREANDA